MTTALKAIFVFTFLTGVIYPLFIWTCGKILFPHEVNGSLIVTNGKVVGSELIAQKVTSSNYFSARPSASDFGTVPSGASNLGATSAVLKQAIEERRSALGPSAPFDLLLSSGSGLDPHISKEAAYFQIPMVSKNRGLPAEELQKLVESQLEQPTFGIFGQERVNVLKLNLLLDKEAYEQK